MMTMDAVDDHQRMVHVFGREIPRELFFARLFYLFYFASFGSLFPLLAVYFKQLGMTSAQAGMLLGCRPLVEFAAYPFWGTFAERFRKGKVLLFFSLTAMIVSTLAIGFVQPVTPYCVVLDKNDTGGECKLLVPAGEAIRGGALGYLRKAAGLGRRKRSSSTSKNSKNSKNNKNNKNIGNNMLDKIVDLSSYDNDDERIVGTAPEYVTKDKVCNYDEEVYGVLVSPPHSTRVYREAGVQQSFMMLLILVILGEFLSSPALSIADGYTLGLVADRPKDYGNIRLFGSIGWGLAMFFIGIGLDYSDTFRNHPCPTKNTTEKNYTLCFVMCALLALLSMAVATQFKFPQPHQQHRPDAVSGLVMDTRIDEVDPAVAQKTRAKQLQANAGSEEAAWKAALKSMMNIHFAMYLLAVLCVAFGAGNIFAFLFWHLQDLGGQPILFGIASIVNHTAEIVAFFYTFQIINKYGYVKTMYMCLGANVVRFLLISWLSNPWMVLPLQVLQGCVLATVWAMASSYISLVSPAHLKSTSQYILNLLYHGVGKGIGPIIGGMFINSIGTRGWFALLALITFVVLCANFAVNRNLNFEGIKYSHDFEDDETTLAPQGLPTRHMESKITDAFNTTSVINNNYGAIHGDDHATGGAGSSADDAYDRYVSNKPYE